MKKTKALLFTIVLFVSFILLSLACASTKQISTLPTSYEEVIDVSGTKDSIYTKANLVFVDLFNNAESVLQFSDKEAGVMKGKYVSNLSVKLSHLTVNTTVEVSVKDGKYRIVMSLADIAETYNAFSGYHTRPIPISPTDEILTKLNQEWRDLASSFKSEMNKDSSW